MIHSSFNQPKIIKNYHKSSKNLMQGKRIFATKIIICQNTNWMICRKSQRNYKEITNFQKAKKRISNKSFNIANEIVTLWRSSHFQYCKIFIEVYKQWYIFRSWNCAKNTFYSDSIFNNLKLKKIFCLKSCEECSLK